MLIFLQQEWFWYEEDVLMETSSFTVYFTISSQFKPVCSWYFYPHPLMFFPIELTCVQVFLSSPTPFNESSYFIDGCSFLKSYPIFIRDLKLPKVLLCICYSSVQKESKGSLASQDILRLAPDLSFVDHKVCISGPSIPAVYQCMFYCTLLRKLLAWNVFISTLT